MTPALRIALDVLGGVLFVGCLMLLLGVGGV